MLRLFKKINFKTLFWVFFYLFLFFLLLRSSFNYLDPDLGWHLKVGQKIISTRLVPQINTYNYTFKGHWVDAEWLSNVGMYFIYSQGGYLALSITFVLLIILVLILLNILAHNFWPKISPIPIILFQVLGLVSALPSLGIRVQEIGLLFLLLLLIILIDYNKRRNWRSLLFLLPLMYLWANLHASFILGFFLLFSWLIIKIIEKFLIKSRLGVYLEQTLVLSWKEILIFISLSFSAFIITLFTPYKLQLYSFLDKTIFTNTFYQSHIQEWLSQLSFPLQYWQLSYLALVVMALFLYIYYSFQQKPSFKLNLWKVFLVSLFVVLSFKSRRHFPLMFVATFWFLLEVWKNVFPSASSINSWFRLQHLKTWLKIYLIFCLIIISVSQIINTKFTKDPFKTFCQDYPCGAVQFLKHNPEYNQLRLFNSYAWGGYLIWVYPEKKLFIDGRLPQVPFAGHTFLQEYYDFFSKDADISNKLKQYNIRLVLLPAVDKNISVSNLAKFIFSINNQELIAHNYLRKYLKSSAYWHLLYKDQTAVIYIKN